MARDRETGAESWRSGGIDFYHADVDQAANEAAHSEGDRARGDMWKLGHT